MRPLMTVLIPGFLTVAATLVPSLAVGQSGSTLAPAGIEGHEIRTTIWDGSLAQYHLWLFAANGAVRGVYHATRDVAHGATLHIEEIDKGAWSIEQGALCLQWRRWFGGLRNCYKIERLENPWIKAAYIGAGRSFKATLAPLPGK